MGQYIASLAQQVCKKYHISLSELRSGSRRRNVAKARGSISWIAVRELGYAGADVARYLGVTNYCVTRFVATGQKPDVVASFANFAAILQRLLRPPDEIHTPRHC